jgi:hypothetical protein
MDENKDHKKSFAWFRGCLVRHSICHAMCGVAELLLFRLWLATMQTKATPKVTRCIWPPQVWRAFVLEVFMAATSWIQTKHRPQYQWLPQSVVWRAAARTKQLPNSRGRHICGEANIGRQPNIPLVLHTSQECARIADCSSSTSPIRQSLLVCRGLEVPVASNS